jgi:hypothetical protein
MKESPSPPPAAQERERPRLLTPDELAELRRDMAEASAWMRAELARRRRASFSR